jgi:hypothetical protein
MSVLPVVLKKELIPKIIGDMDNCKSFNQGVERAFKVLKENGWCSFEDYPHKSHNVCIEALKNQGWHSRSDCLNEESIKEIAKDMGWHKVGNDCVNNDKFHEIAQKQFLKLGYHFKQDCPTEQECTMALAKNGYWSPEQVQKAKGQVNEVLKSLKLGEQQRGLFLEEVFG